MKKEAEAHAEEDRKRKEGIEFAIMRILLSTPLRRWSPIMVTKFG
jgi:hypothetical protein